MGGSSAVRPGSSQFVPDEPSLQFVLSSPPFRGTRDEGRDKDQLEECQRDELSGRNPEGRWVRPGGYGVPSGTRGLWGAPASQNQQTKESNVGKKKNAAKTTKADKKLDQMLSNLQSAAWDRANKMEDADGILYEVAEQALVVATGTAEFLKFVEWGVEAGAYAPDGEMVEAARTLREQIAAAQENVA